MAQSDSGMLPMFGVQTARRRRIVPAPSRPPGAQAVSAQKEAPKCPAPLVTIFSAFG